MALIEENDLTEGMQGWKKDRIPYSPRRCFWNFDYSAIEQNSSKQECRVVGFDKLHQRRVELYQFRISDQEETRKEHLGLKFYL